MGGGDIIAGGSRTRLSSRDIGMRIDDASNLSLSWLDRKTVVRFERYGTTGAEVGQRRYLVDGKATLHAEFDRRLQKITFRRPNGTRTLALLRREIVLRRCC